MNRTIHNKWILILVSVLYVAYLAWVLLGRLEKEKD